MLQPTEPPGQGEGGSFNFPFLEGLGYIYYHHDVLVI